MVAIAEPQGATASDARWFGDRDWPEVQTAATAAGNLLRSEASSADPSVNRPHQAATHHTWAGGAVVLELGVCRQTELVSSGQMVAAAEMTPVVMAPSRLAPVRSAPLRLASVRSAPEIELPALPVGPRESEI